ncbi:MAG: diacylglycerol kinase family lipid kinase [Hungatella sp.]
MYYFIVNPNSKSGRGRKIWRKLERQMIHSGEPYEAYLTEKPGDAKEIAARLTDGCKDPHIIVVMGGDGTVNEVLDGLAFCGPITLGYIPTGSGNDLARSLRLPKRPSRCLKKILNPKYHKLLDYGVLSYGNEEVAHRRFMVSAGIGFDAAVCHNLLYSKLKCVLNRMHLGKLSYILIGLKQLCLAHPCKGYLRLDGVQKVEFNHIYFVSAHIHPYEGGGFKFAPEADPMDGKLTLCVVHNSAKRNLLPILCSALLGGHHRYRGVRSYHCQEAGIHTERPMPVHVDGESCFCQSDLQIRCIERKIRMIV